MRIYDKNGVPRGPAFQLSTLFSAFDPPVSTNNNGDGLALYDRMANRWILSQFAFTSTATPPYHQTIAVSKTSDPTGAYWAYDFITPGNEFPDYGKIGSWPTVTTLPIVSSRMARPTMASVASPSTGPKCWSAIPRLLLSTSV